MNTADTRLTPEQMQLVRELNEDYGIEHDQVHFFGGDPKPTFDAEAGSILARKLADATGVAIGAVASVRNDTITMECGITFPGFFSSGVGSVNINERKDGAAAPMSIPELERVASSRAMRSALVYAGIDLIKLHRQKRSGVVQFTGPDKSNRDRLLSRVHALGTEVGLIDGDNKGPWKATLSRMYGVQSSGELTDTLLEDFAAWLSSLRPQAGVAKAA